MAKAIIEDSRTHRRQTLEGRTVWAALRHEYGRSPMRITADGPEGAWGRLVQDRAVIWGAEGPLGDGGPVPEEEPPRIIEAQVTKHGAYSLAVIIPAAMARDMGLQHGSRVLAEFRPIDISPPAQIETHGNAGDHDLTRRDNGSPSAGIPRGRRPAGGRLGNAGKARRRAARRAADGAFGVRAAHGAQSGIPRISAHGGAAPRGIARAHGEHSHLRPGGADKPAPGVGGSGEGAP